MCTGTEDILENCKHNNSHNCGAHEGAGVICATDAHIIINNTTANLTSSTNSGEGYYFQNYIIGNINLNFP